MSTVLPAANDETTHHIIGGTRGIQVTVIIQQLGRCQSFTAIPRSRLNEIIRQLEVSKGCRQTFDTQLNQGTIDTITVVEGSINDWVDRNGENATIEKLIEHLRYCNMVDAAQCLEKLMPTLTETSGKTSRNRNLRRPDRILRTDDSSKSLVSKDEQDTAIFSKQDKRSKKLACHIVIILWVLLLLLIGIIIIWIYFIFFHIQSTSIASFVPYQQDTAPRKPAGDDLMSVSSTGFANTRIEEIINITVFSYDQYKMLISAKNGCCINLNISISRQFEWNGTEEMSKAKFVVALSLMGELTRKSIRSILTQVTEMKSLYISNKNNTLCRAVQRYNENQLLPLPKPFLGKLLSITLSEFTLCTHFYKFLLNEVHFGEHISIHIVNSNFTTEHILNVQKLLEKIGENIEFLELGGNFYSVQSFYGLEISLPNILKLRVNLISVNATGKNGTSQDDLLDINFCSVFPNLEVFESNDGITYSDITIVLKCAKLKTINATVLFGENDGFWSINSSILSDNLISIELFFKFTGKCPDKDEIDQLGLQKVKHEIRRDFDSNCELSSDMPNSKKVKFVDMFAKGGSII